MMEMSQHRDSISSSFMFNLSSNCNLLMWIWKYVYLLSLNEYFKQCTWKNCFTVSHTPATMAAISDVEEESHSLSRRVDTEGTISDEIPVSNSTDLPTLSETQRSRIVCNRERALSLRRARINAKPYQRAESVKTGTTISSIQSRVFEDTHGGFLLEENTAEEERLSQLRSRPVVQDEGTLILVDWFI